MDKNYSTSLHLLRELFIAPLSKVKPRLFVVFFSLLLLGVSQSAFLLFLGPFLKAFLSNVLSDPFVSSELLVPASVSRVFPDLAIYKIPSQIFIWLVPCGLLLAGLLRNIALYFYQLNTAAIALFIAKNYRDNFFLAIISKPYLFISKKSPAQWMSYLMNDVLFLQTRFSDILNSFVRDGTIMIFAFMTLVLIHWPSAIGVLALSPFIAFGMGRAGKKIAFFAEAFQRELSFMADLILELRKRFDFIRAQGGEQREKERFSDINHAYYAMIKKSLLVRAAFAPFMEFLGFGLFAVIIFLVGSGRLGEGFSSVNLTVFFGTLGIMLRPLRNLGEQIAKFQETKGSLQRSLHVFADSVEDQSLPSISETQDASTPSLKFSNIELHSVSSGYTKGKSCFSGESLSLTLGKTIAIIGPSGGGKSTFLKTLAGLIEPQVWEASLTWVQFKKQTSVVSQDPFLFESSIIDNLLYGQTNNIDDVENKIWSQLKFVKLDDDIKKMPDALNFNVKALNKNLSGGQIQRLVMARALLREKPILLLDEATSAVDMQTEEDLLNGIVDNCHKTGKILIAVTHRLQWLNLFDEIWFIENGVLAAKGSHKSLMNLDRYKDFYEASGTGL